MFFEPTKITCTTLRTTAAELYAVMKCFGTLSDASRFVEGYQWVGCRNSHYLDYRTDAHNLVSTASTTHSPEQPEAIRMIHMLRKEACSGAIADSFSRSKRTSFI